MDTRNSFPQRPIPAQVCALRDFLGSYSRKLIIFTKNNPVIFTKNNTRKIIIVTTTANEKIQQI